MFYEYRILCMPSISEIINRTNWLGVPLKMYMFSNRYCCESWELKRIICIPLALMSLQKYLHSFQYLTIFMLIPSLGISVLAIWNQSDLLPSLHTIRMDFVLFASQSENQITHFLIWQVIDEQGIRFPRQRFV